MVVKLVLLLLGAYLLGAIPTAYLAGRWSRGVDIRQYGSGNVGAANVVATVSKRWAIPVIVFDLVKGMVVVYIAKFIGLEVYQQVTIGIAAIIGHNWPVFLRFSGGRGLLTTVGVVFILAPWLALIMVAFAFAWAPFKQLALGTLCAMILLPIFSWFMSEPLSIEGAFSLTLGFLAMFLLTIIRRLTAPKTPFAASVSRRELFFSRLLFDRDIMDKKAWQKQRPLKPEKRGEG